MSKETLEHLNQGVLIGFTEKRGNAWHYRADEQGTEPNHYPLGIPVADVKRRLFNWEPVDGTITASAYLEDEDGIPTGLLSETSEEFKAIMRSDNGHILGIFKQGYRAHPYKLWLLEYVETIIDATLQIGSAGTLKDGAQGWVQIEMPETLEAAEGVKFRPFLTAATSLDGSLATTYLQGVQVVVCDNTLSAALNAKGTDKVKIRHSRNSIGRIQDVRDGLKLVYETADNFQAQVAALTAEHVSDQRWKDFVSKLTYPGSNPSARSKGMAEKKAGELHSLWRHDVRVAPWTGSAYGVLAAVNTYEHHIKAVRGATTNDRNMSRVITGGVDKLDNATLELLATV